MGRDAYPRYAVLLPRTLLGTHDPAVRGGQVGSPPGEGAVGYDVVPARGHEVEVVYLPVPLGELEPVPLEPILAPLDVVRENEELLVGEKGYGPVVVIGRAQVGLEIAGRGLQVVPPADVDGGQRDEPDAFAEHPPDVSLIFLEQGLVLAIEIYPLL